MNIRSVRPRAIKILEAAGIHASVWNGQLMIGAKNDDHTLTMPRAIAALRAAGWQVDDDGTIRAVAGGEDTPCPAIEPRTGCRCNLKGQHSHHTSFREGGGGFTIAWGGDVP